MVHNWSGIVPNAPKTLLGHTRTKSIVLTKTRKHHKTPTCLKTHFCWKTQFEKVDLIWHLRPIRKGQNDRTLILFLTDFLQQVDFHYQKHYFYLVCLISTPVFHENTLFHLEPSGCVFSRDLSGGDRAAFLREGSFLVFVSLGAPLFSP